MDMYFWFKHNKYCVSLSTFASFPPKLGRRKGNNASFKALGDQSTNNDHDCQQKQSLQTQCRIFHSCYRIILKIRYLHNIKFIMLIMKKVNYFAAVMTAVTDQEAKLLNFWDWLMACNKYTCL